MTGAELGAALRTELLKVRRSRVPLITFAVMGLAPAMGALFVFIVADPQRAADLGLVGQKAQLSGITPDWPGLLDFCTQAAVVASLLVDAFILTWLFGREFVDRCAHYLMALPVSRAAVVSAKLIWFSVLALLVAGCFTAVTVGAGLAMDLPGWSPDLVVSAVSGIMRAAALTIVAISPVAYIASRSRGYLTPLACAVGFVILAQAAAILGWGAIVPWSIPALVAGVDPTHQATSASWVILAGTGLVGVTSTVRWWQGPDAGL